MAGIAYMTPERWNAHFCVQVAQIVTHLQKDELSQAYKIFNERIYPFAENIETGTVFPQIQELSIAIHDLRFSGKERAKQVENLALAHLPGFKPTILNTPEKTEAPVQKPLTTEMDAIELLLWGTSLSQEGQQPVIVKPVAQRTMSPLSLDGSLGLKPAQLLLKSQEIKAFSTPLHKTTSHSL
jgi:hypothetical protein